MVVTYIFYLDQSNVIRPKPETSSFVHNQNKKIVVTKKLGIFKSCIKRNSSSRKLTPRVM
jgi:hypothetical protein